MDLPACRAALPRPPGRLRDRARAGRERCLGWISGEQADLRSWRWLARRSAVRWHGRTGCKSPRRVCDGLALGRTKQAPVFSSGTAGNAHTMANPSLPLPPPVSLRTVTSFNVRSFDARPDLGCTSVGWCVLDCCRSVSWSPAPHHAMNIFTRCGNMPGRRRAQVWLAVSKTRRPG